MRASLELPPELSAQLRTPAGINIGAQTPEEIAISILAELIVVRHADPAPERPAATGSGERGSSGVSGEPPSAGSNMLVAIDPVCGMKVAVTESTLCLDVSGSRVYFCGTGCQDAFALQHVPDAAHG